MWNNRYHRNNSFCRFPTSNHTSSAFTNSSQALNSTWQGLTCSREEAEAWESLATVPKMHRWSMVELRSQFRSMNCSLYSNLLALCCLSGNTEVEGFYDSDG